MKQHYVVKNLGPGLDGLIVEGRQEVGDHLLEVLAFIDRNIMMGDGHPRSPIEPGTLFIAMGNLEEVGDPNLREFAHDNMYGELQYDGSALCQNLRVVWACYSKMFQVTVTDLGNRQTIYSQNFSKKFVEINNAIAKMLQDKTEDAVTELLFTLREMKEEELSDGQA